MWWTVAGSSSSFPHYSFSVHWIIIWSAFLALLFFAGVMRRYLWFCRRHQTNPPSGRWLCSPPPTSHWIKGTPFSSPLPRLFAAASDLAFGHERKGSVRFSRKHSTEHDLLAQQLRCRMDLWIGFYNHVGRYQLRRYPKGDTGPEGCPRHTVSWRGKDFIHLSWLPVIARKSCAFFSFYLRPPYWGS